MLFYPDYVRMQNEMFLGGNLTKGSSSAIVLEYGNAEATFIRVWFSPEDEDLFDTYLHVKAYDSRENRHGVLGVATEENGGKNLGYLLGSTMSMKLAIAMRMLNTTLDYFNESDYFESPKKRVVVRNGNELDLRRENILVEEVEDYYG